MGWIVKKVRRAFALYSVEAGMKSENTLLTGPHSFQNQGCQEFQEGLQEEAG
jgi:hypothetical protein